MKMRVAVGGSVHARRAMIMGTHGRDAPGTLFLGSVAQRVLHGAKAPLLLRVH